MGDLPDLDQLNLPTFAAFLLDNFRGVPTQLIGQLIYPTEKVFLLLDIQPNSPPNLFRSGGRRGAHRPALAVLVRLRNWEKKIGKVEGSGALRTGI